VVFFKVLINCISIKYPILAKIQYPCSSDSLLKTVIIAYFYSSMLCGSLILASLLRLRESVQQIT